MKSKKPGLFLWYVLFEPGMAQDSRPNIVDKFLSLILGPFFSPCRFSAQVTSCTPMMSIVGCIQKTHKLNLQPTLFLWIPDRYSLLSCLRLVFFRQSWRSLWKQAELILMSATIIQLGLTRNSMILFNPLIPKLLPHSINLSQILLIFTF